MPAYTSCVGLPVSCARLPVLELTPTLRAGLTYRVYCRFEETHCFCLRETARRFANRRRVRVVARYFHHT